MPGAPGILKAFELDCAGMNARGNIWRAGFGIELSLALLLLALSRNTFAEMTPCSPAELQTALPSGDPSYHNALSLSKTLSKNGIGVKCILRSTMENTFDGQVGAAVYRTDQGTFEVCFLPEDGTFEGLKVSEERKGSGVICIGLLVRRNRGQRI
jgi:hypothetical protein